MNRTTIALILTLVISVAIAVSGCRSTVRYTETSNPHVVVKQTGPPPHAPAHGYRHKHPDGVELVYKSNIGVYVVVGYSDHYFYKDRYYRLRNGSWEVSVHIDGNWKSTSEKKIPSGLQKKYVCKKKK